MCEIRTFRRNPSNKEKEMSSSVDGPERLGRTWEEDSMKVFSEHFSEQTLEKRILSIRLKASLDKDIVSQPDHPSLIP